MSAACKDPRTAGIFRFLGRRYEPSSGELELDYAFDDGPLLTERLVFPLPPAQPGAAQQVRFERALDLLQLVAGVSYYKAGVAPRIDVGALALDPELANFAQQLYLQGLAEFAHVNGLDLRARVRFEPNCDAPPPLVPADEGLADQALVAMGGGKDSLVSLEMLRAADFAVRPFMVGNSSLIAETVSCSGLPLLNVRRTLAPGLLRLNAAGAWNGHVPVTAINSAIGVCLAVLHGVRWVVFSNERSASEATLTDRYGRLVNHQYSKSLEFERLFRAQVQGRVSAQLEYFSLLRPLSEVAVAQRFSRLTRYHPVFSSCNRNFHRDGSRISGRWCLDCPKCRFTSLCLAPHLGIDALVEIFGANLLDQPEQEPGFRALCALGVDKPFECVGEAAESRALLAALGSDAQWRKARVVRQLAAEVADHRGSLGDWLQLRGEHCIPAEISARVAF